MGRVEKAQKAVDDAKAEQAKVKTAFQDASNNESHWTTELNAAKALSAGLATTVTNTKGVKDTKDTAVKTLDDDYTTKAGLLTTATAVYDTEKAKYDKLTALQKTV